ncbi:uncharacterized protein LTR77_001748 [Saxophila tyrrhenica]|uniref:Heterokaryon incompatibility domain-containing protein n=1 Tax=Saxophila tyrrhenica TaxID=1690608 RepID=A0AAV9PP24_9PEZI|nr:hypothetical protein LTR77_001748 [Saxophila tyrrhenica]
MRLLHFKEGEIPVLTEFNVEAATPPYAILSHCWRADGEEVTSKDLQDGSASKRPGFDKLRFCNERAAAHHLMYFWQDTCCIDKSSSAELQEAINSMFRFYQRASRCYVYLPDVSVDEGDLGKQPSETSWHPSFKSSRWFTRGWTLEELLAPLTVEFYSKEGHRLGDKQSLEALITEATGIPCGALHGESLSKYSIGERFTWARDRNTTRQEDWAYCLLGIFGIVIPMLYGEGKERAIIRLKREISETFKVQLERNGKTEGSNHVPSMEPTNEYSAFCDWLADLRPGREQSVAAFTSQTAELQPGQSSADVVEGATKQQVQTDDSMDSWLRSFQSKPATAPKQAEAEGLSNIKALTRAKGAVGSTPKQSMTDPMVVQSFVAGQQREVLPQNKPYPEDVEHLVKQGLNGDRVHLIIKGSGPSGPKMTEKTFLPSDSIDTLHSYLQHQGFNPSYGFEVQADSGRCIIERAVPKTSAIAVEVTNGPSCYDLRQGYRIDSHERLIDFYNARFSGKPQVNVVAAPDSICVKDHNAHESEVYIDFKRTVRLPEDDQIYDEPPTFASFPLFVARHFASALPENMRKKDGLFFPMLQREALMIGFRSPYPDANQFAIRVYTGATNVLTGLPAIETKHYTDTNLQNHIVAPQQKLLGGYKASNGSLKQFVAMPMGAKYSVEYQLTGEEYVGGIQLEIAPRLRDTFHFGTTPLEVNNSKASNRERCHPFSMPVQLGLQPGQRLYLEDHSPYVLYNHPQLTGQLQENVVSSKDYSNSTKYRARFIHELFGGPASSRLDMSSSLVITALSTIHLKLARISDGIQMLSCHCDPRARVKDLRKFMRARFKEMMPDQPWLRKRNAEITFRIHEQTIKPSEDWVLSDLDLVDGQTVGFRAEPKLLRLGSARGGFSGRSTRRESVIAPGWDMGVALGGEFKQSVFEDQSTHIWNWKAARLVNIQILNSIAFQAVTGLRPPLSPLFFGDLQLKTVARVPEPATVTTKAMERLQSVKAINELDWERGAAVGVHVDGETVVLCVCCEIRICDNL